MYSFILTLVRRALGGEGSQNPKPLDANSHTHTSLNDPLNGNHKQLRDGKGNVALQELSKHLSCLALKDGPTHRLDRNPNLAHRILPFCTKWGQNDIDLSLLHHQLEVSPQRIAIVLST